MAPPTSSPASKPHSRRASCASSAIWGRLPKHAPSPSASAHSGKGNGSLAPSRHLAGLPTCLPISPVIPIARRSPILIRLVSMTDDEVAFSYRDYRRDGRRKIMRLDAHKFIRRFLLHVLPDGFHRIRHHGFLAKGDRGQKLEGVRALLAAMKQPRSRSNRTALRQTQKRVAQNGAPNRRRPLGRDRDRPQRLPARRMLQLPQECRIWFRLKGMRSSALRISHSFSARIRSCSERPPHRSDARRGRRPS